MESVFFRDLQLPEGHRLVIELEECLRQLRRKGNRSLSIMIQPDEAEGVSATVLIEMRVFLDSPRACVFACLSDADNSHRIDLLGGAPKRARVPRAEGYAELARHIVATINEALTGAYINQLAA
jgi:hypothetical protein